jgi:hypothetical protein
LGAARNPNTVWIKDPYTGLVIEQRAKTTVVKANKNSLNYVGETHVYAIRGPDGSIYKIGESGDGVRLWDGASTRAEKQAKSLRKKTGEIYETEIIKTFGNKVDSTNYENRFLKTYRQLFGKLPKGNRTDR